MNARARAQGVTAFLERSNYAKAVGAPGAAPRPGALLEVVVTAARDRRMVHVSADARAAAAAVAREWDGLTLGALAPGARARAPACMTRVCGAWGSARGGQVAAPGTLGPACTASAVGGVRQGPMR